MPIERSFRRRELELKIKFSGERSSYTYVSPSSSDGSIKIARMLKSLPRKRSLLREPIPSEIFYGWYAYGYYWSPEIDVYVLEDQGIYYNSEYIPSFLSVNKVTSEYFPTVLPATFAYNSDKYIEIGEETTSVPLTLHIRPASLKKIVTVAQIMESQKSPDGSFGIKFSWVKEMPSLEQVTSEASPFRSVILIVMVIFYFLMLKNDISFWRDLDNNMNGISVTSLLLGEFNGFVLIFSAFYEAPLIQIFSFVLCNAYSCWKLSKIIEYKKRTVDDDENGEHNSINDRSFLGFRVKRSYERSLTGEYDRRAWAAIKKYLIPVVAGYCLYSLAFEKYIGWFNWIITSFSTFLNDYSFLYFIPQAYVNYELRSVAHLPWRYFAYQTIYILLLCLYSFMNLGSLDPLVIFKGILMVSVYLYQRSMFSRVVVKVEIEDENEDD